MDALTFVLLESSSPKNFPTQHAVAHDLLNISNAWMKELQCFLESRELVHTWCSKLCAVIAAWIIKSHVSHSTSLTHCLYLHHIERWKPKWHGTLYLITSWRRYWCKMHTLYRYITFTVGSTYYFSSNDPLHL